MKAYPKANSGESRTIIHITDTHLYAEADGRLHGVNTRASLAAVLAVIGAAEVPDLLLATGDLAQDESEAAYRMLADAVRPLGVPMLALPGNHDRTERMRSAFAGSTIRLDHSFDLDGWRIVSLDSAVAGQPGGRLATAELERLEAALDGCGRHALIGLHHPPLPVGAAWLDAMGLANADALFAVLDRHPCAQAVLAGHVHQETRAERNGVRYFTTPSTAVQYTAGAERPVVDHAPPGYRRVTLHPDGTLDTAVVRVPQAAGL